MSENLRSQSLAKPILWGVAVGLNEDVLTRRVLVARAKPRLVAVLGDHRLGVRRVCGGRWPPRVLAVEIGVTFAFFILATIAIIASPWLSVVGLVAHGIKDLWQHRTQFVANTRWWPPFCVVVDFVAAAVIAVLLLTGVRLGG